MAQGNLGTSAGKLLRAPAEPARLPYAPKALWQADVWKALAEGVTSISDFLGQGRRPDDVALDVHHMTGFPSQFVGSMRTALYQEQVVFPGSSQMLMS